MFPVHYSRGCCTTSYSHLVRRHGVARTSAAESIRRKYHILEHEVGDLLLANVPQSLQI